MFNSLGWGEILALIVIALFVFGPDRLPKVAKDAGRMLRQLREMANGARSQLKSELGPEVADIDLDSLNPRTFVRKHLLEDDPLDEPRHNGTPMNGAHSTNGHPSGQAPLKENERPPYDADAT
jgi:sec-independent protein translocase protein TatB